MDAASSDARDTTDAALEALLVESIAAWGVAGGSIAREATGALIVRFAGRAAGLSIARAPVGHPLRWLVDCGGGRQRGAASVAGVLKVVRSELDPSWRPGRLRIADVPATTDVSEATRP